VGPPRPRLTHSAPQTHADRQVSLCHPQAPLTAPSPPLRTGPAKTYGRISKRVLLPARTFSRWAVRRPADWRNKPRAAQRFLVLGQICDFWPISSGPPKVYTALSSVAINKRAPAHADHSFPGIPPPFPPLPCLPVRGLGKIGLILPPQNTSPPDSPFAHSCRTSEPSFVTGSSSGTRRKIRSRK